MRTRKRYALQEEQASGSYQRVLALDPSYVKARNNLTYYPKRYRAPPDWMKLIGHNC